MQLTDDGQWQNPEIRREFPVEVVRHEYREAGLLFERHWHREFQIICCEQGTAVIHCNSLPLSIQAGDIVVINANDLHFGENCGELLIYDTIKIDLEFLLSSQADCCQTRYIAPLMNRQLRFCNWLGGDEAVRAAFYGLANEYRRREKGYELAVKGCCYQLFACLLRRHLQPDGQAMLQQRQDRLLQRLKPVLQFMELQYDEKITLTELATLANMSNHHFCRQFKSVTGKAPIEYLNRLRVEQALKLLQQSELNISEVAGAVGFDDINYFSRLFKKYKQMPPSDIRRGRPARRTYD